MSFLAFPPNFLWGTATAAHQVEGQNFNNDWWEWEQTPGRIRNGDSARVACDWWSGRYIEDFDRAEALGMNAHRLSVEWSRLEPREGEWDDNALQTYRAMLTALHERRAQPFVTLLHYTQPLWFMAKGGWLDDDSPRLFERFVTRTVQALSDLANFWITLNEPNLYIVLNYAWKGRPPGAGNIRQAFRVGKNLLQAHALAYHAIHRVQPTGQVGLAHAWRWIEAANPHSRLDRLSARMSDRLTNRIFVRALTEGVFSFPIGHGETFPPAKNSLDYFALNYYFEHPVAFDLTRPGSLFARPVAADWVRDTEFEAYPYVGRWSPASFYAALKEIARSGLPIYVTENGVFDIGRDLQPNYLVTHLKALHRALQDGVDVRGYFWWTLVDNFEWDDGYWLRFGLYHLDVETQVRTPRPVTDVYGRIIHENGIADDLIEAYGRAD